MRKQEFLTNLEERLSGLPSKDVKERLSFYSEMIDDRVDEGVAEEEAVSARGALDGITSQIIAEMPLYKMVKHKMDPQRRLKAWEIILLALGSPIWLSLLIALFSVVLAIYVTLWSLVISLWAVFASLVACAFGGVVGGAVLVCFGHTPLGEVLLACGLVCLGVSIFFFFLCKIGTKGCVWLSKKLGLLIKNFFIKGEK